MGIKSLSKILQTKCAPAMSERPLSAFFGYRVAIDVSIFMYKFMYVYGDVIDGLTRLTVTLLKNGILPVYVFDGKPPKEKEELLRERKEKRDELILMNKVLKKVIEVRSSEKAAAEAKVGMSEMKAVVKDYVENGIKKPYKEGILSGDEWEMAVKASVDEVKGFQEKVERKIIHIRLEHINAAKELLGYFGVPCIVAQSEAESLCAVLCKKGIVDATISEDMDVLATGGCILLKNFSMEKGGRVTEVCLKGVLDGLEMTFDEFLDMCILCGCDYTGKIGGIGPMNAYKLIKDYKSLDAAMPHIRANGKYHVPEDFDYVTSRMLFKTACETDDFAKYEQDVLQTPMNVSAILEFLKVKCPKLKGKILEEIAELGKDYKNEKSGIGSTGAASGTSSSILDSASASEGGPKKIPKKAAKSPYVVPQPAPKSSLTGQMSIDAFFKKS